MTTNTFFDKAKLFSHIGWMPRPSQAQIHDCPAQFRMLSCGVRFGKSMMAANEAVAKLLEPHSAEYPVWLVANNYENVDAMFQPMYWMLKQKFTNILERASLKYRVITLRDGRQVNCRSGEEAAGLEAKGVHFLVVDECRDIRNEIWFERLEARLLDTKGYALLLTSGCKKRGISNWFWQLASRGTPHHFKDKACKCKLRDGYAYFQYPSIDNPVIDKDNFEQIRKRLPDYVYRERYLGDMIETDVCLFPNMDEVFVAKEEGPVKGKRYVAGLDVALRRDKTVLSIFDSENAMEVKRVIMPRNTDWDYAKNSVGQWLAKYNNAICMADETGIGSGIVELLQRDGHNVQGLMISSKGIKNKLIEDLIARFTDVSIFLLDSEETREEYSNMDGDLQNSITPTYKYLSPGSPDTLMSHALANQWLEEIDQDNAPADVTTDGDRIYVPEDEQESVLDGLISPRSGELELI